MKRVRLYALVAGLGLAAAVALALFFGALSGGSDDGAGPEGATSASTSEVESGPAPDTGGLSEGIKVHGHWVIEVREPDGALVSRREFDNSLTSIGQLQLVDFLSRTLAVGLWQVNLIGSPSPCDDFTGQAGICKVLEANAPDAGPDKFKNLIVKDSGASLILSGNAIAARDSLITSVVTFHRECLLSEGTGCTINLLAGAAFTSSAVSPSVSVIAGQQIMVTVTISFS